jgi:hypothetical protein
VPTEAAGRLEGEPPDSPAMIEEHPLRDAASVRVTDQVDLVETELLDPGRDDARMPFERVARVRSRRFAVTGEVEHEDTPRAREGGGHGEPRAMRIAEPMQKNERRPGPGLGPVKVDFEDTRDRARRDEACACGIDRCERHEVVQTLMGGLIVATSDKHAGAYALVADSRPEPRVRSHGSAAPSGRALFSRR